MSALEACVHDVYIRLAQHYALTGDVSSLRWVYRCGVTWYLHYCIEAGIKREREVGR